MTRKKSLRTSGVVQGLVDYLAQVGEEGLLREVSGELASIVDRKKEAEAIEVESVIPLTPDQEERIQKIVKQHFVKELPVQNTINKGLIGGFKIRIADWYLDASIQAQIKRVKKALY